MITVSKKVLKSRSLAALRMTKHKFGYDQALAADSVLQ